MPHLRRTIRGKSLALPYLVGVGPMATAGLIAYYNSVGSVEAVIESRTPGALRRGSKQWI